MVHHVPIPRVRWSHDLVTRNDVSYNGSINPYATILVLRLVLWLTKKQHFVPSLITDISKTQHFILEVDTPRYLVVANKMKSWDLREVRHRRLSSWQNSTILCSMEGGARARAAQGILREMHTFQWSIACVCVCVCVCVCHGFAMLCPMGTAIMNLECGLPPTRTMYHTRQAWPAGGSTGSKGHN